MLISCFTFLTAQPTTIFEVLDLEPDGCPLTAGNEKSRSEAMADAAPLAIDSNKLPAGINTEQELFSQLGNWFQALVQAQPELGEARIVMDEDYTFFRTKLGDSGKGKQSLSTPNLIILKH